jgi:hypothetical protein
MLMKRPKTHTTVKAAIKALGGTASVAKEVGVSMQAVSNWQREEHIPPGYHLAFWLRLRSQGENVLPCVFGLDETGRPLKSRRLN